MVVLRRRRHCHLTLYLLLLLLLWAGLSEAQSSSSPFRRSLVGPGSWPPSCRSKCGPCTPCKAVHVSIQPGVSFPLEYYPEAWRCKCGNKLFMP